MTAMLSGPAAAFASSMSVTVAASAAFQLVGTRPVAERTSGSVRRWSLLTDSNPKRPRSQSQPQLTGSLSTPWYRSSWSRLDCTTVRQPTEQVVQVLSTSSRSQGRALKRYGLAVSAPTGQICTVLPLK
jgi:hypothetical protein